MTDSPRAARRRACSGRRLSLKGCQLRGGGDGSGCGAVAVFVVGSAVSVWGPGPAPHDGELVAVSLVEVVGHHQQSPLEAHLGPASSVEPVDAAVVLGVAEQRLDRLFAFSILGISTDLRTPVQRRTRRRAAVSGLSLGVAPLSGTRGLSAEPNRGATRSGTISCGAKNWPGTGSSCSRNRRGYGIGGPGGSPLLPVSPPAAMADRPSSSGWSASPGLTRALEVGLRYRHVPRRGRAQLDEKHVARQVEGLLAGHGA